MSIHDCEDLRTNQESADTRLILHAQHAIDNFSNSVIIRSPSGDFDIIVLAVFLLFDCKENFFLDSGRSDNRRLIHLETLNLHDEYRTALLGYHAFTAMTMFQAFLQRVKRNAGAS